MSDFLKDLEAYKRSKPPRNPCAVGVVLSSLSPKDAEGLRQALKIDSGYTAPEIAEVLNQRDGIDIKAERIGTHRRGGCSCARD